MIGVEAATRIILDDAARFKARTAVEAVPLMDAIGRILAEDLHADRDFPPFDRVTMDGIALRFADFENGWRRFAIVGTQAAGMPQQMLPNDDHACMEVMTGAMLPTGADVVVRYEDLAIRNGQADILLDALTPRQNIHPKGIDRKQGDAVVLRGCVVTAAEIATAATVGKATLQVVQLPKIAVVSTGDELVDIDETPAAHQIRRSNVYAVAAMLRAQFAAKTDIFHFNDDEKAISEGLTNIFEHYDIVILSGAVSAGKFDFVPEVLAQLGVEKRFHKVSQRPGKPFWFGVRGDAAGHVRNAVFAFPGNPVSTFMCAYRYLMPFLAAQLGLDLTFETAQLSRDFRFKPALTYFLQVRLRSEDGIVWADPLEGGGSGDLANLNDTDGFLELPLEADFFEKGRVFPLIRFR